MRRRRGPTARCVFEPASFGQPPDNFELAVDGLLNVSSGVLQPLFWALIVFGSMIGIAALLGPPPSSWLWLGR